MAQFKSRILVTKVSQHEQWQEIETDKWNLVINFIITSTKEVMPLTICLLVGLPGLHPKKKTLRRFPQSL